jgi:Glycosyl transferase family 2
VHPADGGVSVVIPTRQRRSFVAVAVHSALAQRDVEVEVIVVDEASTDGTVELVREWGDERIRLVEHARPRGVAAARNEGLRVARYRWVAFLDDDDVWAPEKLHCQLSALVEQPNSRWSCTAEAICDERLRVQELRHPPSPGDNVARAILRGNIVPGGGSSVLADLDLVRDLGGFDLRLRVVADWDMWTRLAQVSPLAAVDEPLVAYRRHAGNMSRRYQGLDEELKYFLSKHEGLHAEAGVQPDLAAWSAWVASNEARAGRRLAAFKREMRQPQGVSARGVARASARLLAPRATRPLRELRRRASIPPETRTEIASWLQQYMPDERVDTLRPSGARG